MIKRASYSTNLFSQGSGKNEREMRTEWCTKFVTNLSGYLLNEHTIARRA